MTAEVLNHPKPLTRRAHTLSALLTGVVASAFLFAATECDSYADDAFGPIEWSEPARLAVRSMLLDAAVDGNRLIAVGERGHVLLSEDGGASWTVLPVGR